MQYLWDWFLDLNASRLYTDVPNGLTYQEIEAFERCNRVRLSVWEIGVLRRLDAVVVAALNSRIREKQGGKSGRSIPITDTARIRESLQAGLAARKAKNK